MGSVVMLFIAALPIRAGVADPETFFQGLIVGLVLGITLSEIVLPRLVDVWFVVRRHRDR